jgi:hypothetical protein
MPVSISCLRTCWRANKIDESCALNFDEVLLHHI